MACRLGVQRSSFGVEHKGDLCPRASKGRGAVSATELELGPIDYLVVEWPAEKQPTGEAFPLLVDLVDRGLIRVLDLARNPELALFEGASSGLLGEDDYAEAAPALEPGCSAALLVYENTWAAPFATALRRSGAQLVANGRIPVNAILAR